MSEAGISDRPNRDDSAFPEGPAVEAVAPQPSNPIPSTAVARFEQRIAGGGTRVSSASEGFPRLREADWFSLARKLRQRNRDLLKKVASLEQSLAETQEALQNEIARSRSSETLNAQQAKELQAARAKIGSLYRDLEASNQTLQQHRTSVEGVSDQLDEAVERVAQLERECTVLQQRYDEQSQQLEAARHKTGELSARLERQQRRTLQFKAALDRCLEEGAGESRQERDRIPALFSEAESQPEEDSGITAARAQPIQPWSRQDVQPETRRDRLPPWANKTLDSHRSPHLDESERPAVPPERAVNPTPPALPNSTSFESFEQLQPIEWEVEPSDSDPFDAMFEIVGFLDESASKATAGEPEGLEESLTSENAREAVSSPPAASDLEAIAPPQSNFPAPLVYPHRTQRKHLSLASIELPKFLN
ncbi:MAG: hypothetical protein SVX43_08450 [Cyanobacteriota bacterium]|nr:hypothetical protein [Cyanobacteriota bacterium]